MLEFEHLGLVISLIFTILSVFRSNFCHFLGNDIISLYVHEHLFAFFTC